MFRLAASAQAHLSDEAIAVAEQFLAALPPHTQQTVRRVRLFGPQARRFDPDAPFDLLVVAETATWAVRAGVSIGVSTVESSGLYTAHVTVATDQDVREPTGSLRRLLQNAEREGVDLWSRPETSDTLCA